MWCQALLAVVVACAALIAWPIMVPRPITTVNNMDNPAQEIRSPQVAIPPPSASWSLDNIIAGQVERVEWAPHIPWNKEVTRMREPVILSNTVVNTWKAKEAWKNLNYLAHHPELGELEGVQCGPDATFGFIDNKTALAKAAVPGIDLVPRFHELNMSAAELFQRVGNQSDPMYYYWYGKLKGTLKKDVQPNDFLWMESEDKDNFGLFMWLSSDNVRPPIHYDQDHNFFVHLVGRKRFVLFPPWEWPHMHGFPRIHPRWHKSQCSFDNPDLEKCPHYRQAKAYEAILDPGDVLYVPPYWWHHVEAISTSVSLASWSQSGVYRTLKTIYERELPFDVIEDPKEKAAAMKAFLELIMESIYGKGNVTQFIQTLVDVRWSPIKDVFEVMESYRNPNFCDWDHKLDAEHFRERFEQDVKYVVERLTKPQGLAASPKRKDVKAIRDQELGDYIEFIAADVLGAENVYGFLLHCWNSTDLELSTTSIE